MSCNLNHQSKNTKSEPIKYLALGDSYTIGESVLESERWPVQLVNNLKAKNIDAEVNILAKTGWTTDELLKAIKDSTLTESYDLVSLLIGVNNQYRGRSVENFKEEFRVLLNTALAFAGNDPTKVFVVSIPDWGVTPFAMERDKDQIAGEIDHFNQICEDVCLKNKVLFIDITDISRNVYADEMLVAADGLHPSGKMYAQWVDRIFPYISEIIDN
ncbi:MAG: SGNH/GDSL hydrolase family protein [Bacteroidetes bacterium]|nr:SGNH/GDSL hydrolase family protein [Bacteroidota bacterium]